MTATTTAQAITVRRNMRGELEARNILPLPNMPKRALHVSTYKASRGLVSTYTVQTDNGDSWTWEMFGDYSARTDHPGKRGTEKTIAELQAQALATVPDRLEAIAQHYAKKDNASA